MSVGTIELRESTDEDREIIFAMTQDPRSNEMARVFPRTREQFERLWAESAQNPRIIARTIVYDGIVVGKINSFPVGDETHVGCVIARSHWGMGIGSRALQMLIEIVKTRPLIAHIAKSNIGSCRIAEKSGFVKVDERESPETERYMACLEAVYELR